MFFVNVILPLPLNTLFTYSVDKDTFVTIEPGMRVIVPFGKNKLYTAVTFSKHQNKPSRYDVKKVYQVLDKTAIIPLQILKIWHWVAEYYMCSIGEVLKMAMPNYLLLKSSTYVSINANIPPLSNIELSDEEYLVIEALSQCKTIKIDDVKNILNNYKVMPVINRLLARKYINIDKKITSLYKPKEVKVLSINSKYNNRIELNDLLNTLNKYPKQYRLVMIYLSINKKDVVTKKDLLNKSEVSASVLNSLIKKNVFKVNTIKEERWKNYNKKLTKKIKLTAEQEDAKAHILNKLNHKDVVLLQAVSSSGKKKIFIEIISEQLEKNPEGQILYVLPEFTSMYNTIYELQQIFGNKVIIYHHKHSNEHEKTEIWQKISNGHDNAQIIIGTSSSIWLCFNNLKLAILHQEHENTYKNSLRNPRYNTRDSLVYICKQEGSKLILSSSSPSIESYFNAKNNKYELVSLKKRHNYVAYPHIQLINLKEKRRKKQMEAFFSDTLLEAIDLSVKEGHQVILFQNKRGYSPIIECNTCGYIPKCEYCDVSLVFHKEVRYLKCHYCGYQIAAPYKCHKCTSIDLDKKGIGTEQVESKLNSIRPNLSTIRLDSDTVKRKGAYQNIIDKIINKEVQVIIGNRLVYKSLNFKKISLIGVIDADNILYQQNFRANEQAYQTFSQLCGQAGKDLTKSKLIIQTNNPDNIIFKYLENDDYLNMYNNEIIQRKLYNYPPYTKIIAFILKGINQNKLDQATQWLTDVLRNHFGENILGPTYPSVQKIKNKYIKHIYLKITSTQSIKEPKSIISKIQLNFKTISFFNSISLTIDVDTYL